MKLQQVFSSEKVRYVLVGALTTVVSLGSYWLLTELFLDPYDPVSLQIANILSWVCAVAFAYVTNRVYVFQSTDERVLSEAVRFVGARVATLLTDMICMAAFVSLLHMDDRWAKLAVQVIVFVLNYLFSKLIVFIKE